MAKGEIGGENWAKRLRNGLVAALAVLLAAGLFLANQARQAGTSLAALAAEAVPWEEAQANASLPWGVLCRLVHHLPLHGALLANLKKEFAQQINFVMLNVDNPKWLPELSRYRVNGVPHFLFLDSQGEVVGSAIGEQPASVLRANLLALAAGDPLPLTQPGPVSALQPGGPVLPAQPDPRTHG
jgi:thiol-disulfide isomerase/thioredoxin